MKTYVFPGQGSQVIGMGVDLFDLFPALVKKADDILGYSIKSLCLENPDNKLRQTCFTQPALYVVNALSYLHKKKNGFEADFLMGHSLGEFSALFAGGAYDFETGLKLVKKRGELMFKVTGGGMAAIKGMSESQIKEVFVKNNITQLDIANFNTTEQIVISGPEEVIRSSAKAFNDAGAKLYFPLNVSGAFHSRCMIPVREEFENYMKGFQFTPLKIPVISNVEAKPYTDSRVQHLLANQLTSSVRWTESVQYLIKQGCQDFEEIGPGNVLTKMIWSIKEKSKSMVPEHAFATARKQQHANGRMNKQEVQTLRKEVKNKNIILKPSTSAQTQDNGRIAITAKSIGSASFKKRYGIDYAYLTGGMYRGIASPELVVNMAKRGFLSFLGTGGHGVDTIKENILQIKQHIGTNLPFGCNIVNNIFDPEEEMSTINLYLEQGVKVIEAAAFMRVTPALVKYRLKGLKRTSGGQIEIKNRIIAKTSRPEIAEYFLSPPPNRIIKKLLEQNQITAEEAELSKYIPLADDITMEADSGGHTDRGIMTVILPAVQSIRDEMQVKYNYKEPIHVGAAGGIGTPAAAAAAFILGADYVLTGSINQCTLEAGINDVVKDLLEKMDVKDTDYAIAGDMFELGAQIQVLKKGLFFPARSNKLYELYKQYDSIESLKEEDKRMIQERYFKKSFEEVYEETKTYFLKKDPNQIVKAEKNPKHKMALIFRWYFGYSWRLATQGIKEGKVDFQIHTGSSMGAFNRWVKGTSLESWRNRHVHEIAQKIMQETAKLLNNKLKQLSGF